MTPLVMIVLGCALKGAVLLTTAGGCTIGLRRASASVRHLTWTLAVMGLCVLPILSVTAPRWRVPILPPSVGGPAATTLRPEVASPNLFRAEVDPERILQGREGVFTRMTTDRPRAADQGSPAVRPWGVWLLYVWAGGVATVLARLLVSLVAILHKGRQAAPITDGAWRTLVSEIALRYGIRRPVSLRVGAGSIIPATWGLGRHVVFLPVEALDWSQDRLRAVLSHELAHVARGDFLVQTLARFACALHWFNPLAWLAERRLRVECERASDDRVLNVGLSPTEYAGHLVEVLLAAQRRPGQDAPRGALAMARRSGFEERLRAILDSQRCRRKMSKPWVALMAVAAIGVLVPLGFVRLEARAHDAPKLERLPQGMTVEVIGVSSHPSGATTWWGPDGTPLPQAPCDPIATIVDFSGPQVRELVARITGLPEGAAIDWHPTQCRSHGTPQPLKDGIAVPQLQRTVADFTEELAAGRVHFDIAVGAWVTEQTAERSIGIEREDRAFFFGKPRPNQQGTAIAIAHNISDRVVRVVAIDRNGVEHRPRSETSGGGKHLRMLDVEFDVPPSQIREYRLQSRQVGRFEIKNVTLQPRKAG